MQGTAIAAVLAGRLAGHLRDHKGWNALRIRTLCQDVATLGTVFNHTQHLLFRAAVVVMMITVSTVIITALCSRELGSGLPTVHSVIQTNHTCWVLAELPCSHESWLCHASNLLAVPSGKRESARYVSQQDTRQLSCLIQFIITLLNLLLVAPNGACVCAGPAVSLAPLIMSSQGCSVATAVLCLTGTLSLQAFCYAGFHAYVQVSATAYCPSPLYRQLTLSL